jgi:hypothetical protein
LITKKTAVKRQSLSELYICPSVYLCVVVKELAEAVRPEHYVLASRPGNHKNQVVGVTGVEPVTLRLSSACSNQLSYTPVRVINVGGAEEIRTPDL